ncbi:gypsy retrotransposon integrase 1, partial [Pelobates cultripes]
MSRLLVRKVASLIVPGSSDNVALQVNLQPQGVRLSPPPLPLHISFSPSPRLLCGIRLCNGMTFDPLTCLAVSGLIRLPDEMETKYNDIVKFLCFGEYPPGYSKTQRQTFRQTTAKFTIKETVDAFKYIFTATDYFSKWVEAFPLKSKCAAEVGRHICSMVYRHGCPKRILSDQGKEFVNQLSNIIFPEEKNYVTFLNEKKASVEKIKEKIEKSQEKQKTYALKKNKDVVSSVGDEVLLYNMRKRGRKRGRIEPDFSGPYIIKELCGKVVKLENSGGVTLQKKFSIDHIKPYRRSEENKAHSTKDLCHLFCCTGKGVKILWEAEDDGSVEAVVGPYKLYVSSFRTLHGNKWLVDEVIDAYIHHLIVKHQ